MRYSGCLLLMVVLLLSCSGRESYAVEITDHSFVPGSLSVSPGTTVVWKNTGLFPKTVTATPSPDTPNAYMSLPRGAPSIRSDTLYPGETWSYIFTTPGAYTYVSRYTPLYEPNNVLVGVVEVSSAASGDIRPAASVETVPQQLPSGDSDFLVPRTERKSTTGVIEQTGPEMALGAANVPGERALGQGVAALGVAQQGGDVNQQVAAQLDDLSSAIKRLQQNLNQSLGD